MKLTALAFFAVMLFAHQALAQEARNAAYFELGGSAVVPSFNYERRLNERWFARIGASIVEGESSDGDTARTFVIPLTASSVNRPSANHHLELGGGILIAAGDRQDLFDLGEDDDETFSTLFVTGIVGYRYQKPDGGFQFRAVFTPVAGDGELLPWAGVSFGYAW
ncbi:MAG TPA: hypothetical protein VFN10_06315 [Thermoanaerobaculia bacterium]|nr:hypothetical protein [Thermoanaerobaculia bacterium]